jgi:Protein of unknown function (DUF4240)
MGLFSKLFGQKNSNDNSDNLSKTSEMLDEDLYWKIVQESLDNSSDQDGQEQFLINRLKKLSSKEIIGFRLRTDKLLYDTYNSEMWCAGYIMNGGCSDDSFEYFRNWIISKGKVVYYDAKNNPDSLISQVDEDAEFYDFESFWYVALEAFQQTTGKELYEFIDDDNFNFKEGHYPKFEFTWQEDNPASMKAICPRLFDKMWK